MGNLQPWGVRSEYRRALDRFKEKREAGFKDFRQRVEEFKLSNGDGFPESAESIEERLTEIVSLTFFELREKLQSDELNAVTVLTAYVKKALEVNDRINCCTEVLSEAFDMAEAADEKWAKSTRKPPLYGIPFSVKSNFYMKNYDCTVGVAKLLDDPKTENCPFIEHLINLGGIPFVLTNVPQGLLSYVCSNTVYGTTLNPLDLTRVPGGSSGGEAALLAGGGSVFGTGSDLAGSLRIPASMCGLTTLKPTQDRFVVNKIHAGMPGRGRLGLSFGFFTRTVEEQIFLLSLIVGDEAYRQLVPQSPPAPLSLEKTRLKRPIVFGYYDFDGFCPPVPSHKRVVLETVERLKSHGHVVVKFVVPEHELAAKLFYKNIMLDNGAYMRGVYENEDIDSNMTQFVTLLKTPRILRWIASKLLAPFSSQMSLISASYMGDLEDVRYTQELTDNYRETFIDYWKTLGIDALICPAFIVPAVPHRFPAKVTTAGFATGLFNLLDFPAGVVPTGTVTKQDDVDLLDERKFPIARNPILKMQRDAATTSVGLPCSVQCVALPFEEELCLHAMQCVENLWKSV
ncbi:unnamed protein product [Caenorhabditis auriculariae]|uniref:Amidase domain-containing protein n=1 Tax=Caenorhabditis auriculariae TaxID=2777116 RepID=A0A8S1HYB6_9PELO|nr:unnamed protein product [Caenorhabditis auriculariae]